MIITIITTTLKYIGAFGEARNVESHEDVAGEHGDEDWTEIVPTDDDRDPTFAGLNEGIFRE